MPSQFSSKKGLPNEPNKKGDFVKELFYNGYHKLINEGIYDQMKPIILCLLFSLMISFATACNMPQGSVNQPDSNIVATKVALTLWAFTQSAQPTLIASPTFQASLQATNTQIPSPTSTNTMSPTNTKISTLTPTTTKEPTNTPIPVPGTIAGNIYGYPFGSVPRLAIIAFGQEPPYNYSWMITGSGETYFSMSSSYLIPGHYQVVAYDSSGHAGGCTLYVMVISNETVNCDITNWGSGYPVKPSGVPNP